MTASDARMHTSIGLLWTKDRPVAESSTCTTHVIHKGRTFVPPAGFELSVPESQWPHTCALDCAVTGIVTVLRITGTLCGRNGVFPVMSRILAELCVCPGQAEAWMVGFSFHLAWTMTRGSCADRRTWVCNTEM